MKTRNIITIISLILALVSCSSDSDILNEMNNQTSVDSEMAVISCAINNVQSKADVTVDNDKKINSVVFFLLDKSGSVLGYRSGLSLSASFQTKNQAGLRILAVANAATGVTGLTTENAIMNQVLNASDLAGLVKVGSTKVAFTNNQANVTVTVSQIAARIDLSSLTITAKDAEKVVLESVELVNKNVQGKMNATIGGFTAETESTSINQVIAGEMTNVCHFYSFANNATNATALVLHFDVDGKKVSSKEITIKNTNKDNEVAVVGGCNHQLSIRATIQGDNVTPEVSFTVADWNKSQILVDMTE